MRSASLVALSVVSTQYACNQECRVLTLTLIRSLQSLCSMQMKDHLKRRQLMAQSLMLGVGPSPLPRRSPHGATQPGAGRAPAFSGARARPSACQRAWDGRWSDMYV